MARTLLVLLCALPVMVVCISPASVTFYRDNTFFFESFEVGWEDRWIHSQNSKFTGRCTTATPKDWGEAGLQLPDANKYYGISALLPKPVDPINGLVVQYEVKFMEEVQCGGAYLKLISQSEFFTPAGLTNETPYSIMFGPDICGPSNKVHLIFRHKNPITGVVKEHHLKQQIAAPSKDDETHIYTLTVSTKNKFEILIDGQVKAKGDLMKDFEPAFQPPKAIPDPNDKKPADWVDDAKIPDPTATKPANWDDRLEIPDESAKKPEGWLDDEPPLIADPRSVQPEEWDDEEDGTWEAPMVPNPKCKGGCGEWKRPMKHNPNFKGPWTAPLIDNPAYKGSWEQKMMPNPEYFEVINPLRNVAAIGAVAIEVWTVDRMFTFDSIMLASDAGIAKEFRDREWQAKRAREEEALQAEMKTREEKSLGEMIALLFESGPMEPLKPYVLPLLDVMIKYPVVAYVLVFSGLSIVFYFLAGFLALFKRNSADFQRRQRVARRKAAKAAAAKHSDTSRRSKSAEEEDEDEDEDGIDEDNEEEEKEVAMGAGKEDDAVQPAKAAAAGSTLLKPLHITEIEEEEDNEEEAVAERPPTNPRPRKPKA